MADAASAQPAVPPSGQSDLPLRSAAIDTADFDIVATYHELLASDANITKPVAAINALIALLNAYPSSTAHETLEIVKTHSHRLKKNVNNPLPPRAGLDLFREYLKAELRKQEGSFDDVRRHLLRNGRTFVDRAVAARTGVAEAGQRLINSRNGEQPVILTYGASRCVTALLETAARRAGPGGVKFKIVVVRDELRPEDTNRVVSQYRSLGIPVAEVSSNSLAHVLELPPRVNMVLVGAEAVTHGGGIINRMGTWQIAKLAAMNRPKLPFYVAAETHKFVNSLPMNQELGDRWNVGIKQQVYSFDEPIEQPKDAVDWVPHEQSGVKYIDGLITENGIKQPIYVVEQLLEIYHSLAQTLDED